MAPAMQPAEVQFAQRLASSEKGVRDRAVRKLRQYLSVKTQSETGGFSQEELLKIWKGLFYCMWVQDEPLLQEELANTISQLIHVVNSSEAQSLFSRMLVEDEPGAYIVWASEHLFIQTFWQTMNREWKGIDKLHLDKYYMLIRLVLRQSFEVLKRNGWEESRIELFVDVLMKEILCPESQSPDGVRFHFINIYLDELSKVGGKELLADQNLKFIDPFCRIVAKTKDHTLVQTIARGVFEVIVDQAPLIPEDTVEEQKTRVDDGDLSEEETFENEAAWKKAVSRKKTALRKCHSRKERISDERERKDHGPLEDTGLLLQFDYKAVADRLLEITNKKNIPPFNRKRLCKLIKKFQGLSEGGLSQLCFPEDISAEEDDQALSQRRHKKKRRELIERAEVEKAKGNKVFLAEEEDSEGSIQKRKRKKKKKSHPQPETWGLKNAATPPAQSRVGGPAAAQRQAPQVQAAESRAVAESSSREESSLEHPPSVPTHSRRKRLKRKSLQAQGEIWDPTELPLEDKAQSSPGSSHPQGSATQGSPTDGAQVLKRKRKLGMLPVNGSSQATLTQCRRPQKKKAESGSLDLYSLSNQKTTTLKKRKKMKEMSNLIEHNGILGSRVRQIQALGSSTSSLKKQPLRTEKDFVKFDTHFLPKPLFFRKAKSGAATRPADRAVQLNRTPSSTKKVTFGLNRNTTAEFKKTDKSILVSPTGPSRVAFNPEQRPLHGVLKTPTSSPASTALATKKLLAITPKRRPTAMDFF